MFVQASTPVTGSAYNALQPELASIPTLSIGILSATQGAYSNTQMALDITQGARVAGSAYDPFDPPSLQVLGAAPQASAQSAQAGPARAMGVPSAASERGPSSPAQVFPWAKVLTRARSAPQLLEPGSLATHVPGGSAYVPADGVASVDGVVAADRTGRLASVWLSPAGTLPSIQRLLASHRLVVADLPSGAEGYADLRALASSRSARELLIVIERAPENPHSPIFLSDDEMMWSAVAGLGPGGQTLTSQTTNQRGLIAAIDIAPTILEHLGLPIPADMRGRPIHAVGALDSAGLRSLKSRLGVISSRRLPALAWLVAVWALLLAGARLPLAAGGTWQATSTRATGSRAQASLADPTDPRGRASSTRIARSRAQASSTDAGYRARSAWAMRVGALAIMWMPVAVLVPAAIEPSRTVELATIVAICFALGMLTDRLAPWPRAPVAPAAAAVLALSVDALAGTQLLMRSLLGPDPILGARFYGIGNELKSALAVLVFAAVAAALYPAARSRRAAAAMAGAGILLAIVEGSARVGAGVGGVILVSAGTAVATVMLLPGALDRKRILLVTAAPVAGLIALAALDLATAHGSGHFTGSVLDARSAGDIRDIIVRRYGAAWDELKNHLMPLATALALVASVIAIRRREQVCAPVDSDPAWLAALAGGLTAGVIGALTEDSGPVLLVVAVLILGCVLGYLWGKPLGAETLMRRNRGTRRAGRSRALRRSAAPSG